MKRPANDNAPIAGELRSVLNHPRCLLLHGDAAHLATRIAVESVDALVSDPPAGIGFMAKEWDRDKGGRDAWIAWLAALMRPALAVLKPGGHGLVWALPRTSHWTAMALELAGFEIRDVHHHIFGTGFPKSLTSKSAPIPESAGTALKPAVEHWILVRKPLEGTVGGTFAKHATGVLNIAACRVAAHGETFHAPQSDPSRRLGAGQLGFRKYSRVVKMQAAQAASTQRLADLGRWPAHLSLEHGEACGKTCAAGCPVLEIDAQSGNMEAGVAVKRNTNGLNRNGATNFAMASTGIDVTYGDRGGASRFFYVAKGSRSERDAGLAHLAPKTGGEATGREDGSAGTANPRAGSGRTGGARNFHPTVKSVTLMRWLVRLVTPPGGLVLDMFAGSGTTGVAALAEGRRFVGIELTDEYIPIAEGRLRHALARDVLL